MERERERSYPRPLFYRRGGGAQVGGERRIEWKEGRKEGRKGCRLQ
jgi:hypothetical protein